MKPSILCCLGFAVASTAAYLPRAIQTSSKITVSKTPSNGIEITLPQNVVDELNLVTLQVICRPSKEKRDVPPRGECAADAARTVARNTLRKGMGKLYWQAIRGLTPDELAVFNDRQPRYNTDLFSAYEPALGAQEAEAFTDPLRQRAAAWLTAITMVDSYDGVGVRIKTGSMLAEANDIEEEICPVDAPKGKRAPMCISQDCQGGRVGRLCSVGKWRFCPCNLYISPIYRHPMDERSYDFSKPGGEQVQLFEDILSSVDCQYEGDKTELKKRDSLLENDYCSCSTGSNYPTITSAPDGQECAYSSPEDLPQALPNSTNAGTVKLRFTQRTRKIAHNPIQGTYQILLGSQTIQELNPDQLGGEPTLIGGGPDGMIKIDFNQLPAYAALTSEHWREDLSFNFTYFPTRWVSTSNYTLPIYQKDAIAWNTNNADGTRVATSLPGYSCDDLTKVEWLPRHEINYDWQTRTWECSFLRLFNL